VFPSLLDNSMLELEKSDLLREFPDLGDANAILAKEMYAHFGLLFFVFALVEHTMINVVTFCGAYREILRQRTRTREGWQKLVDKHFLRAKSLTFGALMREVLREREFQNFSANLRSIKDKRNYFAHHFFRDEAPFTSSEDGLWFLLIKMNHVRREVKTLDEQLEHGFDMMCDRMGIPVPTKELIKEEREKDYARARELLVSGLAKGRWE
jgi:hypothetical protein